MKCYKCGNQLPDDSKFCQYCGTDLSAGQYCKHCGEILNPGMKFCPKCGCKIEDQEECKIVFEEVTDTQEVSIADKFDETEIPQKEESVQDEIPYISKQENASESTSCKRGSMKVVVIVLCLFLIAVGGCFFIGGKDKEVDISDLAKNVLYLEVYDAEDNCIRSASGFLIDEWTLVTNAHVIEDAYSMIAMTADGKIAVDVNTLLACDEIADIAVLKCDERIGVPSFSFANSDEVKQGDEIYAIGYPLGVANTVSNGIISSRYINDYGVDLLQITAPISHGSSGGVLVNPEGEVVGVICAFYEEGQNMNLAVASNTVKEICEKPELDQSIADRSEKNEKEWCIHNYGATLTITEPTCTENGQGIQICTKCGERRHIVIPTNGLHVWQAASCTTPEKCQKCGLVKDNSLLEHQWVEFPEAEYGMICTECSKHITFDELMRISENNPSGNELEKNLNKNDLEGTWRYEWSYEGYLGYIFYSFSGNTFVSELLNSGENEVVERREGTYKIEGNNIHFYVEEYYVDGIITPLEGEKMIYICETDISRDELCLNQIILKKQ